jgi:hypothetical protein
MYIYASPQARLEHELEAFLRHNNIMENKNVLARSLGKHTKA